MILLSLLLFLYASLHWGKRDAVVWSIVVGRWSLCGGGGDGKGDLATIDERNAQYYIITVKIIMEIPCDYLAGHQTRK